MAVHSDSKPAPRRKDDSPVEELFEANLLHQPWKIGKNYRASEE